MTIYKQYNRIQNFCAKRFQAAGPPCSGISKQSDMTSQMHTAVISQ